MHQQDHDAAQAAPARGLRLAFSAMACPCQIVLDHEDAAQARLIALRMRDEVLRIEAKYSRYRDDSVLARINAAAGSGRFVEVDEETAALLDYAATAWQQSDGLFDPSAGVLRRAWNFRVPRVPSQDQIAALLPLLGWQQVQWQRPQLALPRSGMELDFGGFGKEYAADCAAAIALAAGMRHGFVDLGGDIRVLGPDRQGAPWRIGIRDPRQPSVAIASLAMSGGAIATSGDYERGFTIDGRRYGHVLSPLDGWPVQSYASVSVLAPQCLIAGTATTVAMLKGCEAGRGWLLELGLPWLTVAPDGSIEQHALAFEAGNGALSAPAERGA